MTETVRFDEIDDLTCHAPNYQERTVVLSIQGARHGEAASGDATRCGMPIGPAAFRDDQFRRISCADCLAAGR